MKTIHVYDPPMCCTTGVCGPQVDPALAAFAGFLRKAQERGWTVERFNLAQQPLAFLEHATVRQHLEEEGERALPMVFVNGVLRQKGSYPPETERSTWMTSVEELGA